jgi:hypothetical protein
MTSFTDTLFFSSCSVLPLSVREVQWNEFFLFVSYVLLFFQFQIFLLLPRSYLFMSCSAFVQSLQQVYDERLLYARYIHNGQLTRLCSLLVWEHSHGVNGRGSLQSRGSGISTIMVSLAALGSSRYVIYLEVNAIMVSLAALGSSRYVIYLEVNATGP